MKPHAEPSPRTLRLLMSWEKKYGLDAIRQHLDEGLFSRDQEQRQLSYQWLDQRKAARRNNMLVQTVVVLVAVIGTAVCCFD